MRPKKGEPPANNSNRIRFIMLDADISDGNLSELTQAITSALQPINGNFRQIAPRVLVKNLPAAAEQPEESLDAEYKDATPEPEPALAKASKSGNGKPKKSKPPNYLHDLIKDSDSLKAFAAEKKPTSKAKQYLTAMYWLKEVNGTPMATMNSIYTFYKTAGWSVGFSDWAQPFHKLVFDDLIRKARTRANLLSILLARTLLNRCPDDSKGVCRPSTRLCRASASR